MNASEANRVYHQAIIGAELAGLRLDQALARLFPDYSRSRLQGWVRAGRVRVDGQCCKPKDKVFAGARIELEAELMVPQGCLPEPIALNILYQDTDLIIIDKPAGLVVHPGAGNPAGTLQNGLLHHDPRLEHLPRAGIVHRLDKDTSGVMVVARSLVAYTRLVEAMQARHIRREYLAIVSGRPSTAGRIEAPIGRHPRHRTRMAVVEQGKPAITHYRVQRHYRAHSLLALRLETGRTHQIRVHLSWRRMPIVGDPVYGGRPKCPPQASPALRRAVADFPRQALHACRLTLRHPRHGREMSWEAPMADDFRHLLEILEDDANVAIPPTT